MKAASSRDEPIYVHDRLPNSRGTVVHRRAQATGDASETGPRFPGLAQFRASTPGIQLSRQLAPPTPGAGGLDLIMVHT
jgi:hypothetical protein